MIFLDGSPNFWSGELITQYHEMEHRTAVPMIIRYLDRLWYGSAGLFPLLVSHIALFLSIFVIVDANRKSSRFWSGNHMLFFVSALAFNFSLINTSNLNWDLQMHVSLSILFTVLSAKAAARIKPQEFPHRCQMDLIKCNLYSWLAAYSFGHGLPILFTILLYGIVSRWPRKYLMAITTSLVALVVSYLYLLSLRDGGLTSIESIEVNFLSLPTTILSILGSSLAFSLPKQVFDTYGVFISCALGSGLVILLLRKVLHFRNALSNKKELEEPDKFALLVCSSIIGATILIWLSRTGDTVNLVDRYAILSTIFIIIVPIFYLKSIDDKTANVLMISFCLTFLGLAGHFANITNLVYRWHFTTLAAISTEFEIHIPGPNNFAGPPMHIWPQQALSVWENHRERLRSNDASSPILWKGRQLSIFENTIKQPLCNARIFGIFSIPNYDQKFIFKGYFSDPELYQIPKTWIVAVTTNNEISGLGVLGHAPEYVTEDVRGNINRGEFGIFFGYLEGKVGDDVEFFSKRDGSTCLIGRAKIG
ncbi:MAG: hypothetical protein P8H57_13210 [Emcibacteraceae bacterium]|nr:hypothetical protein [Emcibacteraceae bacterium]